MHRAQMVSGAGGFKANMKPPSTARNLRTRPPAQEAARTTTAIDYAEQLMRHLTARAEDADQRGHPDLVLRYVLAHGRLFDRLTAEQPPRMARNACHQNSAVFSRRPGMIYVEGFALVAVPSLVAFEHAWCVDTDGRIHEVTWETPGLAYFGVPFDAEHVGHLLSARYPEHGLVRTCEAHLI